jgi:hypothetical protein
MDFDVGFEITDPSYAENVLAAAHFPGTCLCGAPAGRPDVIVKKKSPKILHTIFGKKLQ